MVLMGATIDTDHEQVRYLPTPDEISAACESIRHGWSDHEEDAGGSGAWRRSC
jgi:hypothetical protein